MLIQLITAFIIGLLMGLVRAYRKNSSQQPQWRTPATNGSTATIRNMTEAHRVLDEALAKKRGQDTTKKIGRITLTTPDRPPQTESFKVTFDMLFKPYGTVPTNYLNGCSTDNLPLKENTKWNTINVERIADIDDNAFEGFKNIENIFTDESLNRIGKHAFANYPKLTKVVLHEGLTHIDDHAFANCSALTEIHIPSTVVSIGDKAFDGCCKLQTVYLPDSTQAPNLQISPSAFNGCSGLQQEIHYTYEKGMCTIC